MAGLSGLVKKRESSQKAQYESEPLSKADLEEDDRIDEDEDNPEESDSAEDISKYSKRPMGLKRMITIGSVEKDLKAAKEAEEARRKLEEEENLPPFLEYIGGNLEIAYNKFIYFLEDNGFYKYEVGKDYIFVHVQDHKVSECQVHHIRNFINRSFSENVFNFLIKNDANLFTKSKLGNLQTLNKFGTIDKQDESYTYFKDFCYLLRPNQAPQKLNYDKLPGYIWARQALNRNVELIHDIEELQKGEFYRFLKNVCNQDDNRFECLLSAIGYLLHDYFDPSNAKAIILLDEKIPTTTEEANGGTGKSIIGKAVLKLKGNGGVELSGKRLNLQGTFSFQAMDIDTTTLFINDAKAKFPFELLFNGITDGFEIEHKRQRSFRVENIKVVLSTNHSVLGFGNSYERRKWEFELSDFYNAEHTPIDDFGHNLFLDWGEKEWNYYDSLMLHSIQLYLENGLINPKPVNTHQRKIMDSTSPQFYEFYMSGYIRPYQQYVNKELYSDWKGFNDYDKKLSQNQFTRYLSKLALILGWEVVEKRGNQNRWKTIWFIEKTPEGRKMPIQELDDYVKEKYKIE